jgi:predicted ester cyclase
VGLFHLIENMSMDEFVEIKQNVDGREIIVRLNLSPSYGNTPKAELLGIWINGKKCEDSNPIVLNLDGRKVVWSVPSQPIGKNGCSKSLIPCRMD